jgi:hypothetical protein
LKIVVDKPHQPGIIEPSTNKKEIKMEKNFYSATPLPSTVASALPYKAVLQQESDKAVAEFLKNGGKIQVLPTRSAK